MDVSTFRNIELFAWSLTVFIVVFVFGYFLVFVGIAVCVRYAYIRYKQTTLEHLRISPKGKTVVVTGCDTGFGHSLAIRLYQRGFNVFATCLKANGPGGLSLKGMAPKPFNRLTVVQLDITSDSNVQEVLALVSKDCADAGLWGVVNNAGQNFLGDAELTTMDQYLRLADINTYGMVRMCKAFLPLLRQARGRIVNVTSVKGRICFPVNAPYTMTKYAGEAFSDTLRQEMASFGVKVIVMEPGKFGGATGCLNAEGMSRIESQMAAQWEAAREDVRTLYGQEHLQNHLKEAKRVARASNVDTEPVISAFDDALTNVCPKDCYLVDSTQGFFDVDVGNVLVRIAPFLPQRMFEALRNYFFPYEIHQ